MPSRIEKPKNAFKAHYLSKEVVRLTGLSKYMVSYLRQIELLVPIEPLDSRRSDKRPRYGKARLYTFSDILLGRSLCKLLSAGVSVKEIEEAVRVLREKLGGVPQDLVRTRVTMIGKRILIASPNEPPVELTADGQLAFSYMLDVKQLHGEASKVIAARHGMDERRVARHQKLLA
jgi:DNA-binding transcriptional MerR regulator